MRISDWSSDVCSSDLERPADRADRPRDAEAALLSAIRAREPAVRTRPRPDRIGAVRVVLARHAGADRPSSWRTWLGAIRGPLPGPCRPRLGDRPAPRFSRAPRLIPNLPPPAESPIPTAYRLIGKAPCGERGGKNM